MNREELIEAFKDKPVILKAIMDSWFPHNGECAYCSKEFRKKRYNQKSCSVTCANKIHNNYSNRSREYKDHRNAIQRAKNKKTTKKCGMCGKEYIESTKKESRTCGTKCLEEYNNYVKEWLRFEYARDKVITWD